MPRRITIRLRYSADIRCANSDLKPAGRIRYAFMPHITVIPLSARVWKKKYLPTHVQIPLKKSSGLNKPSMALAEQVETLDKTRLGERIGEVLDDMVMEQITVALQIQIGAYAEYN